MLHANRHRAKTPAQRQRSRVAHEHLRGRRIVPEEAKPPANQRTHHYGKLRRSRRRRQQQVVGKARRPRRIGDETERRARDHHLADGQAIQTVREVHRIARTHDHERAERDEAVDRQVEHEVFQERQREARRKARLGRRRQRAARQRRRCRLLRVVRDPEHRDPGDHELHQEPHLARKPRRALLGDLLIVVDEADAAEADRHKQHDPDVLVFEIAPQQRAGKNAEQDEEAAHGGRALLRLVAFRAVGADRLTLALPRAQPRDHGRAKQHCQDQPRRERQRHAEGDETEQVHRALIGRKEFVQHATPLTLSARRRRFRSSV